MTYSQAVKHLATTFGMSALTARNVLLDAFMGQSSWFGGSQSPYRVVYSHQDGYRVLDDGYVIKAGAR